MLNERQTGLGGSTQRLHHKDTNMWIYKCNVGEYTESSFFRLLYVIFIHRFNHLLKGEGLEISVFMMGAKQDRQVLIRKVESCGLTAL